MSTEKLNAGLIGPHIFQYNSAMKCPFTLKFIYVYKIEIGAIELEIHLQKSHKLSTSLVLSTI
jgi:hypothetical protein